jgi:hypothetical protein
MTLSLHQNAGQNLDMKIADGSVENMAKLKHLRTTVTNQISVQKEITRRMNSGNAYYHSVQNRLSSRLLSKNVEIRIYKIIILSVVLYGCETWSLTLSEEHRPKVCENRVLRRIFGPKRDGMIRSWRKRDNVDLHNLYSSSNIIRMLK